MAVPTNITGGDLNDLWRVANVALPTVENVYREQAQKVHEVNDPPDDQKYGKCHPWWTALGCQLEQALFQTAGSLGTVSTTLNGAIDQFTHVDGRNAKELNELGEELDEILESENAEEVKPGVTNDYQGPNHNLPDAWLEVHDD